MLVSQIVAAILLGILVCAALGIIVAVGIEQSNAVKQGPVIRHDHDDPAAEKKAN